MKCIDEIPSAELKGTRVLLRAGLDLPLVNGEITDIFRLKQSCATIEFLSKAGARVIVIAKIGRDPEESLAPVAEAMKHYFKVSFVHDIVGTLSREAVRLMRDGDILMLENLQQDPREVAGDESFAQECASLGEIFVNDAFPSAHRASASMVGIPKFLPSYAGIQFYKEVRELSRALQPPKPSIAIIGGAKFETKDPIIRSFLEVYDHVAIVGAIANDILKEKGFPVGRSKVSEHAPAKEVCEHPHLLAPIDVTIERLDKQSRVKKPEDVEDGDKIVDIGPDTIALFAPYIAEAKFITWNGPTGIFEQGFDAYTKALAELISHSSAQKVIGGGDTIAAIEQSGIDQRNLGFLSTGGGAMLEYLLKGTLPAIAALE